jgi:hypothetical protein
VMRHNGGRRGPRPWRDAEGLLKKSHTAARAIRRDAA